MDVTVLPNFKGGEKEFAANMFFDGTNRIFKGRLVPGASIGVHTHEDSCEVIFILEGSGTILEIEPGASGVLGSLDSSGASDCSGCSGALGSSESSGALGSSGSSESLGSYGSSESLGSYEGKLSAVSAGDCLYCPKGHTHSLRNISSDCDLVFYAVVPQQ